MSAKVVTKDITGVKREVFIRDLQWRPAAYALIFDGGKILLTKQHGAYHLPGGGIELGETPEETAIREVYEETGAVIDKPKLFTHRSAFFTYSDGEETFHCQSLQLYFTCQLVSANLSTDNFTDYEQQYGEMPEWISVTDVKKIKNGGTVEWVSMVSEAARHANPRH